MMTLGTTHTHTQTSGTHTAFPRQDLQSNRLDSIICSPLPMPSNCVHNPLGKIIRRHTRGKENIEEDIKCDHHHQDDDGGDDDDDYDYDGKQTSWR